MRDPAPPHPYAHPILPFLVAGRSPTPHHCLLACLDLLPTLFHFPSNIISKIPIIIQPPKIPLDPNCKATQHGYSHYMGPTYP